MATPTFRQTALAAALATLLAAPVTLTAWAQSAQTKAPVSGELAAALKDLQQAQQRVDTLVGKKGGMQVIRLGHGTEDIAGLDDSEERLVVHRRYQRPVLGVVLEADAKAGTRIAAVTPGSAAAEAGLKSGDRIVTVNGQSVRDGSADARLDRTRSLLADLDTQKKVALAYERDGQLKRIEVQPKLGDQVMVVGNNGEAITFIGDPEIAMNAEGRVGGQAKLIQFRGADGVAPLVRREIIRLGPDGQCKGDDCRLPVLAEAFRWKGLNLASVDAGLGRYFGTDHGVLVLSAGGELAGLQAGDVIHTVDGKRVASPREVMDTLRARKAGDKVAVSYLRDRKSGSAQVIVPEPMRFHLPTPPAPPAPPAPLVAPSHAPLVPPPPPAAPSHAPEAPLVPPAPPAPPVPPAGLTFV